MKWVTAILLACALRVCECLHLYKNVERKYQENEKRRREILIMMIENGSTSISNKTLNYLHNRDEWWEEDTDLDIVPWHQMPDRKG